MSSQIKNWINIQVIERNLSSLLLIFVRAICPIRRILEYTFSGLIFGLKQQNLWYGVACVCFNLFFHLKVMTLEREEGMSCEQLTTHGVEEWIIIYVSKEGAPGKVRLYLWFSLSKLICTHSGTSTVPDIFIGIVYLMLVAIL